MRFKINKTLLERKKHFDKHTSNNYHFVSSTDEDGNSSGVLALLDDKHVVFSSAKADFPHQASGAQFLWSQLAESGDDAAAGGDGDQLNREKFVFQMRNYKHKNFQQLCNQYLCNYIVDTEFDLPQSRVLRPSAQRAARSAAVGDSLHHQSPTGK